MTTSTRFRPTRRAPASPRRRRARHHQSLARAIVTAVRRATVVSVCLLFFLGSLGVGLAAVDEAKVVATELSQSVSRATGLPLASGAPGADDTGPIWGGRERVNILLLGLDCRADWRTEECRTNTMMVATIDPASKTAGLLSFPRDLWVTIPLGGGAFTEGRINTAWPVGFAYRYPGGGSALAKQTIEYNFGIRIHSVAYTRFEGVVKVIDTLGGVTIDVTTPIKDDTFPTPDYRTKRIYYQTGLQHMDGETAFEWLRTRHGDSDFGRAYRQQKVILAIRERALQLDILPKLPQLFNDFKDSVFTDLTLPQIIALARLGKDVDVKNITTRTVPGVGFTTASGAQVLLAERQGTRKVISEVFADPEALVESAPIDIRNETPASGLALRTAELLIQRGYNVISHGGGSTESRAETIIYFSTGYRATAEKVANALGISRDRLHERNVIDQSAIYQNVQVLLGKDYRLPTATEIRLPGE